MDSISPVVKNKLSKRKRIRWIEFPAEKDKTDSQLAIEYAVAQGCNSLTLVGFSGGRTDHFLSALLYLSTLKIAHIEMILENETMYLVRKKIVVKGKKGQVFH